MITTNANRAPIGIFDSGLGGLSVVNALKTVLPHEDIVYFGDTGRVPYGTRSSETIEQYTRQDIGFLQKHQVKLIIAACGTVSSVAPHVGMACGTPFLGVVVPAALEAAAATKNKKVGVIGTAATVKSGSFSAEIAKVDPEIQVFARPCQMFVQLVEEGMIDPEDPIPQLICERYLAPLREENVDTLILGCTHFPLLAPVIRKVMGPDVTLIDTGAAAAAFAARLLNEQDLLSKKTETGECHYFVSDRADTFSEVASRFLGQPICDVTQVGWE